MITAVLWFNIGSNHYQTQVKLPALPCPCESSAIVVADIAFGVDFVQLKADSELVAIRVGVPDARFLPILTQTGWTKNGGQG